MREELHLSRRGLLQMVSAIVVTASYAARRPLFESEAADETPLDAQLVEDEQYVTDHTRGAKLERFLRSCGIKPAHLARESGYSREHLLRIRLGRITPSRRCIADLVMACRRLSREPVRACDLFELTASGLRVVERMRRRLIE